MDIRLEHQFQMATQHHLAGRLRPAEILYRQVLQAEPNNAQALHLLGYLGHQSGHSAAGVELMRQALAINPALPECHNNLGLALHDLGQIDAAVDCYRQALALRPAYAKACNNLGNALRQRGELDAAIACYDQALALDPASAATHSNKIYALYFHPRYDAPAILAESVRWQQHHAAALAAIPSAHANERAAARPLRVGYVSPDFYLQAEAFFVLPLLAAHDHRQFAIHAYASVARPDEITERLRRAVDVWHDVRSLDDAQLAAQIRADGIDILVDLTMHMGANRLLTFARKPAPVQVTWLAYPGGTGLPALDYRLTDARIDPPGLTDRHYVEQSLRLPDCWCCYDPLTAAPPAAPRPHGADQPIVFGSLNNPCKINPPLLALWAAVLRAVPQSRLLVLAYSSAQRQEIGTTLGQAGVAAERLEFAGQQSRAAYLRLYERIDIALDTLPYNGITTTCDALWMGVPVLSLSGPTAAGRAGHSILATLGLPELAAGTPEQFVRLAAALAGDGPRLADLRATLRARMERSPLMDAPRFARNVEAAYRLVWKTWCG